MKTQPAIKKESPPYLLGLLCFIPLIGAFVGLGLMLYGIIKYKDRWLTIIGVFGIVFTIVVYSSLFYITKNSTAVKNGFAEISKSQLNNLVSEIELYKLQTGAYPDSLMQLLENDKFAPINDPVQLSSFRKKCLYHYQKEGEKYCLYSSGIDGIANTKDDIYPHINFTDSSKIGLLGKPAFK